MNKKILYIILLSAFFGRVAGSGRFLLLPDDTSRLQADSIMKSIHNIANKERDLGRYEYAEKLYRDVVRLKETYAPDDTFRLANVYGNYANFLSDIWKNNESLVYNDKALEMADYTDTINLGLLLSNKGALLLRINDVSSGLKYFDQVEKYLTNDKSHDQKLLKQIYYYKFSAFYGLKKDSLKYLDYIDTMKGLTTFEKHEINLKRYFLYSRNKEHQKAALIFNNLNHSPLPKDFKIRLLLEYGDCLYVNLGRIDDAIKIYHSILNDSTKSSFIKYDILRIYNNLGNCYETKKMYKEALENYQKGLIYLYPGFTNTDIKSDPPVASIYEEAQNITLFRNKAEVLYKYSKSIGDTSYLNSSLQNSVRSINAIQKMRYRVTSDQSQFLISKKERSAFNLAQYIALEKYSQTRDKKYLNLAFEINEKGRSFTLLSAMRNKTAMDFGDIPNKIRKQESELNRQLSLYDELLYKERQQPEPDRVKISSWEDQLFNAGKDYSILLRKLERDYPEYYQLKFDEKVTDLFDIQKKIDENTVLVEYSYMDSVLIIYTASQRKMDATKVYVQPGFEDKCIEFLNLINKQNFSDKANETFNRYTALAYELYSIVIEPIKDQIDGVNLIVVPDATISYLPFDALLTSKVPYGEPDYRHIPYLVKDFSVGYSYSSTIHFNPLQHIRIPSESILAFAPVYSKANPDNNPYNLLRSNDFLDLVMLPGVTIEVNNISEMLKTDAYYNVSAKESVFKELAGRYKVLHLAMHTMIDNSDPMLSRLVFTQIPDGEQDGLLHTYEIYNMKLNASLTVLSSCSSGYGKIQPGEGVQSLARGFAYAGCPSILMTLWEVGDFSTVLVMTDFYKFLKQHKTKPQALRESKLIFIDQADDLRSNPFFWGSYVIIGDSSPIYPVSSDMAAFSAFMLLLPLGFLRVYYKKFKIEEKRQKKKAA
jgi:CHAT domain-containing protein